MHSLIWNSPEVPQKYFFSLAPIDLSQNDLDQQITFLQAGLGEGYDVKIHRGNIEIGAPASSRVRGNPNVLNGATHTLVHGLADDAFGPTLLIISGENKTEGTSMSGQSKTERPN